MKKVERIILIQLLSMLFSLNIATAQDPGAPPPPDHESEGTQGEGGRGAPIGGGILILLSLGATYGGYKTFTIYQKIERSRRD